MISVVLGVWETAILICIVSTQVCSTTRNTWRSIFPNILFSICSHLFWWSTFWLYGEEVQCLSVCIFIDPCTYFWCREVEAFSDIHLLLVFLPLRTAYSIPLPILINWLIVGFVFVSSLVLPLFSFVGCVFVFTILSSVWVVDINPYQRYCWQRFSPILKDVSTLCEMFPLICWNVLILLNDLWQILLSFISWTIEVPLKIFSCIFLYLEILAFSFPWDCLYPLNFLFGFLIMSQSPPRLWFPYWFLLLASLFFYFDV